MALYAAHTNLDNVAHGVNRKLADKLGLQNVRILDPKPGLLAKLITYVPAAHTETVLAALYAAGAGQIGQYSGCSFRSEGTFTFTPGAGTNPFTGTPGQPHTGPEDRVEVLLPLHRQARRAGGVAPGSPLRGSGLRSPQARKHPPGRGLRHGGRAARSAQSGRVPAAAARRPWACPW